MGRSAQDNRREKMREQKKLGEEWRDDAHMEIVWPDAYGRAALEGHVKT